MQCEICNQKFTRQGNLTKHINKFCWKNEQQQLLNELTIVKNQLIEAQQYKIQLEQVQKELEFLQLELKHQNDNRAIELKYQSENVIRTEARALKFEDHILRENCKPRNVIINNLAPYNLTAELSAQICERYTEEHFKAGPDATYEFLMNNHLTDDNGRRRLACVDVGRQIFKGKKEDGSEFTDVGATRVINDVVKPLKAAIHRAGNVLYDELDDELIEKKKKNHYRSLEPKRLKKKLAGDLHS